MNRGNRIVILFAIILITQSFAVLSTQVPTARANPGVDDPKNIHLTCQGDPTSTITITWQTTYSTSGDDVLYDNISRGGDPLQYGFQVAGSCHTYAGLLGYIHDAKITGLSPDMVYYFICGGPGNYSSERSLRTAPAAVSEFRFVIGGDSRTDKVKRSEVSKAMSHFNPSFVLHCADMVEDGRIQTQWDSWFADVNANWTGDNGLTIPIIPCLGNHEFNSTNYYEQFALPDNEQWYYYDWGPTLRIIVLNSEALDSQIQVEQVNWLEDLLSKTPENMWKIVMFHRNIYYAGGHYDERNLHSYWVPVFDKYHVDVVVQGHSHLYHRTQPMNHSIPGYSYREGTMYLTAGAWGAPLHAYVQQSYSAYGLSAYHFVLASMFQNGSLHLEAKDINGQTFDSVWLHSKLKYWDFPSGMYLISQGANITQPPLLTNENLTVTTSAPNGTTSTLTLYCATKGSPLNVTGVSSWIYNNDTEMFTATILHLETPACIMISWLNLTRSGPGPEPGTGPGPGSGPEEGQGPGPEPEAGERPGDETPILIIELSLAVFLILGIIVTFGSLIKKSDNPSRPEGK